MKIKVVMSPPRVFQKPDLYFRRRWRRIQHFNNEFWSRWRKKFIQTLQERQKWVKMSRSFCIGDIVLLKTDLMTWNHSPMCKVIGANSDGKGVVQSVKLLLKNYHPRQIGKNLFLVKNETSCCDNAQIQGCAAGHYQIK